MPIGKRPSGFTIRTSSASFVGTKTSVAAKLLSNRNSMSPRARSSCSISMPRRSSIRLLVANIQNFAGFEVNEAGVRCRFYNGPTDNNPSSFCEGNRSRILLQGRHGSGSDGVPFSTTPNQIFDWIVSQHRDKNDEADRAPDDCIMRRYKAGVDDLASLARFIDDNIVEVIAPPTTTVTPAWILKLFGGIGNPNSRVLIRGPQGCGKSTTVMRHIPIIYD